MLPEHNNINFKNKENKLNLEISIKGSICRLHHLFHKILGKSLREYLIINKESILNSCVEVHQSIDNRIRKWNILNYHYINKIILLNPPKTISRDQFLKKESIKRH